MGQATELVNKTSTGSVLSDYSNITYDGAGDTTQIVSSVPAAPTYSGTTAYGYDLGAGLSSRGQLTGESTTLPGGASFNFSYDPAGNPTTWKGATVGYNANNQTNGNTYDGNGNPTNYLTALFSWDAEDNLTNIPGMMSAGYMADGMRAWKQPASGAKTFYLYDGGDPVIEMDASGNVQAVNTFVGSPVSRHTSSGSTFYTFDSRGDVSQRLDASQNVLSSDYYDAYGSRHSTGPITDPFGYKAEAGYYSDTETGLIYLQHRYYDPGVGRFLNRDPIGYAGGINIYGYCGNNPVDNSDPSGNYSDDPGNGGYNPELDPWQVIGAKFDHTSFSEWKQDFVECPVVKAVSITAQVGAIIVDPEMAIPAEVVAAKAGGEVIADVFVDAGADAAVGAGDAAIPGEQAAQDVAKAGAKKIHPQECHESSGGVYGLTKDGKVDYVGRTNNFAARQPKHRLKYPDHDFEPLIKTDNKDLQRGLEQMGMDHYHPGLNGIRGIAVKNPRYKQLMDGAKQYMDKNGLSFP